MNIVRPSERAEGRSDTIRGTVRREPTSGPPSFTRTLSTPAERTNEQWPLYTRSPKTCSRSAVDDSECGFIECATRQLFLRGLSHAEAELGLWLLVGLDFALFHYQGIFLVQRSGRSHLCLYRQLLLCAKIFLAGPTSAEVREARNRKTFDEITYDEKCNKYYGMKKVLENTRSLT